MQNFKKCQFWPNFRTKTAIKWAKMVRETRNFQKTCQTQLVTQQKQKILKKLHFGGLKWPKTTIIDFGLPGRPPTFDPPNGQFTDFSQIWHLSYKLRPTKSYIWWKNQKNLIRGSQMNQKPLDLRTQARFSHHTSLFSTLSDLAVQKRVGKKPHFIPVSWRPRRPQDKPKLAFFFTTTRVCFFIILIATMTISMEKLILEMK